MLVTKSITMIPIELKKYLGEYRAVLFDSLSGEPVSWGYPITTRVGEVVWKQLSKLGSLECSYPNWYLVTKTLDHKKALSKYGEVTNIELGPRGGFRSITYGKTQFCNRNLYDSYKENDSN